MFDPATAGHVSAKSGQAIPSAGASATTFKFDVTPASTPTGRVIMAAQLYTRVPEHLDRIRGNLARSAPRNRISAQQPPLFPVAKVGRAGWIYDFVRAWRTTTVLLPTVSEVLAARRFPRLQPQRIEIPQLSQVRSRTSASLSTRSSSLAARLASFCQPCRHAASIRLLYSEVQPRGLITNCTRMLNILLCFTGWSRKARSMDPAPAADFLTCQAARVGIGQTFFSASEHRCIQYCHRGRERFGVRELIRCLSPTIITLDSCPTTTRLNFPVEPIPLHVPRDCAEIPRSDAVPVSADKL